jgi:hypothetical protein
MNNLDNYLIQKRKNEIYYWSKHPYVNAVLLNIFNQFLECISKKNYELTLDKEYIYTKFITLIYYSNLIC